MADTFKIDRWQESSESISDERGRMSAFLDYGGSERRRRTDWRSSIPNRRRDIPIVDVRTTQYLDVLLFCAAMALWMSGAVMLAFGFYLVLSQYGWAVLTGSTMYWLGMLLQSASAISVLIAAAVTTTVITPDFTTAKKTMAGFIIVIISALLLISEIIVCSVAKQNQKRRAKDYYMSIMQATKNKIFDELDLRAAKRKGFDCKHWDKKGCNELYRKYTEMFINFLIGSASVTLGIIILVIPVLYLFYRNTVQKNIRVNPTPIVPEPSEEQEEQ